MKEKYLLMFIIGVLLVTVGLWLSRDIKEGLADTSSVVLVSLTPNNTYYADQGLTNLPNWSPASGTFKQVSGSMGQLIGVNASNQAYYGTQFNIPGSPYNWLTIPGSVTQVSYDYPLVVGLTPAQTVVFIDNIPSNPQTATWAAVGGTQATKTFRYIETSLGRAYGAGTDNQLWYCDNIRVPVWVNVSTGVLAGATIISISFDGDQVGVITSNNIYFFADTAITTAPNWKQTPGGIKQISIKNRMAVCIGTDNVIYFAPSAKDGNWQTLSGPPATPTWVELYFPTGAKMITQRPVAPAACKPGFSFFNGQCLPVCPAGFTESGTVCAGIPKPRTPRAATVVPPLTYTCPDTTFEVNLTTTATCNAIVGGAASPVPPNKEVFAIGGYAYTQTSAQAKCASYGATLATVAQVTAAQVAGADWCSCSWTTDGPNSVYPNTNNPAVGCGGGSGMKTCGNGFAGANCFGVKPPQAQFSDVLPFNGTTWNQTLQCPVGTSVQTTGNCISKCPSGTWGQGTSCIYPSVPKTQQAVVTANYTCPSGYDPPAITTCSGSTCGPAQTCYSTTCPGGYTRSGTTCVANRINKPVVPVNTAKSCPAGLTLFVGDVKTSGALPAFAAGYCAKSRATGNYSGNTATFEEFVYQLYPSQFGTNPDRAYDNCYETGQTMYWGWGGLNSSIPWTCNSEWLPNMEKLGFYRYNDGRMFTLYKETLSQPIVVPCDPGWTQIGSTCYQNCPAGHTDAGTQCQPPNITNAATNAVYTPPCPAGWTQSGSTCYQPCPSSSPNDIGNNMCQQTSVTRTSGAQAPTAVKVTSSLTPCNASEETVNGATSQNCVPLCTGGDLSSPTACTPPNTNRTGGYDATYKCNSNETLENGVCRTKCPDGTYPDGELCQENEKVVPPSSKVKCISTAYGSAKKWLCDTLDDAGVLLKSPSPGTNYVANADQVCVADDPTTGMYFCVSGTEAKAGLDGTTLKSKDYNTTCSNLQKNYTDLSNSLTTLLLIQSGMQNGKTQLGSASTALKNIYDKMGCASPPADKAKLCTQILTASNSVGNNSSDVGGILTNLTPKIQTAIGTRDDLLAQKAKFQCPS